ncbi:transporter substrate-binding domain-containing protein [Massilia sp. H-1]|nr:transporter substrate-binding domain-containing protein [Massilia sp. H-1]
MSKLLSPVAFALLLPFAPACAAAPELVMLAPANHAMPVAQFQGGVLTGGILWDMGTLIAARLGRSVRFVTVPSRRVGLALTHGDADGVCLVQPSWIDGSFQWTADIIPTGGVVLARRCSRAIARLTDLRGKKVGTVIGYRYRYLEPVLGKDFVRDDAPSVEHALRKLMAGRTQYTLMELSTAAWHVKNDAALRLDITYENSRALRLFQAVRTCRSPMCGA